MSEVKNIMDFLGVGQLEGNVRGEHLMKLLTYLKRYSGDSWDRTRKVLPLIVGMQKRYIKENYVEGLIELGVIKLYSDKNVIKYKWFGESAFNGSILPEEVEVEQIKIQETKNGICPNCNKIVDRDKKYCNEKCLRDYIKKKRGSK